MKCHGDGAELRRTERGDAEIDVCPDCRGMWLDRGELDKIVAHSLSGRSESESFYRERESHSSYVGELFDF